MEMSSGRLAGWWLNHPAKYVQIGDLPQGEDKKIFETTT